MTKAKGTPMGRASIFRPKVTDSDHRYQGYMTVLGREKFEAARVHVADLARTLLGAFAPQDISDADVFEYGVRGDAGTRRYMKARRKELDAK